MRWLAPSADVSTRPNSLIDVRSPAPILASPTAESLHQPHLTHLSTTRCAAPNTMLFHALLALLFSSVAAYTDRGIIKLDNR